MQILETRSHWVSEMQSIDVRIKRIGQTQRLRYETLTLPTLAIEVAEAAKAREINEEDAAEIYATYIKESTGLEPIRSSASFRVNSSKIRQIIRCKSPTLLRRVMKMHGEERTNGRLRPLYPAMVDVCRLHYSTGKVPTDNQIRRIVRQKRYD